MTSVRWWSLPSALQLESSESGFSSALWTWADGRHESIDDAVPDLNTIAFAVDPFHTDFSVEDRLSFTGAFRSGMLALVPSGRQASVIQRGGGRKLHLYLPDSLLADAAGDDPDNSRNRRIDLEPRVGYDVAAANICRRVLAQFRDNRIGSTLLHDALGIELAVHAIRHWTGGSIDEAPATRPLPTPALRRVVDYLHSDIAANPSLRTLSELVGLSPAHFCRSFSAATGYAPHRYLIRLRVQTACDQLRHTERPVGHIANGVGYDDPSYFARIFKRHTGLTPVEFRNQHRPVSSP
jgi:AraC family transcriptional regulator